MNNLKIKILETVKNNDIRMIPKWKFVLYSSLAIMSLLFVFLVTVFLFSLIFFVLSRYGFMYMPFFKSIGAVHALRAIPILLLLCTIFLLVLIEIISRYSSFSWRRPLGVTFLVLTSGATVISYVISQTNMHDYVRSYAKSHHFDMMSQAYERPLPFRQAEGMTVVRGEVIATSSTTATLLLFDGVKLVIRATSSSATTFVPPKVDDDVIVMGTIVGDHFDVDAIQIARERSFGGRRFKHMRNNTQMEKNMNY